jgi:eukaryotic-like serine/threonine-protein kinase
MTSRGTTRTLTTVALAGLAVLGAVVGAGTAGADGRPAAPAPGGVSGVSGRELREILLTPAQVGAVTGALTPMTVVAQGSGLGDVSGRLDPRDCISAWAPAQKSSYAGSGWRAVNVAVVGGGDAKGSRLVTEGIVGFATAGEASRYVDGAATSWAGCADKTVAFRSSSGALEQWRFGKPRMTRDHRLIMIPQVAVASGLSCERAAAARGNFVIDVLVCGADPSGQGVAVVGAIADNVGEPA